jgi:hypothetical protein
MSKKLKMTIFWTWWKFFKKCQKSWMISWTYWKFFKNRQKSWKWQFFGLSENFSKNVKKVENDDFLDLVKIFQKSSKKLKMMISWTWWKFIKKCQKSWKWQFFGLSENFSKIVKKVENDDFLDLVKICQKSSKKLKMTISWT